MFFVFSSYTTDFYKQFRTLFCVLQPSYVSGQATHIVISVVKESKCLPLKAPFCNVSSQNLFFSLMRFEVFPSVFSPCTCIIALLSYMTTQSLCSGISHCKSAEVHFCCFAFVLVFHSFVFTLMCCSALMGVELQHSELSQPLHVEFTQPGGSKTLEIWIRKCQGHL